MSLLLLHSNNQIMSLKDFYCLFVISFAKIEQYIIMIDRIFSPIDHDYY
ncbi:hypothetical protein ROD_08661 [Citrobacter rodentium ICC168]|uniref:Uncharacterized protein n=1 Tax=Citrobacter rodentium (strain ICC168) TaxID=637910 RepID=D2TR55_CITRI|nr:hypothetical protein ROD_08661 [Citrobacter rodentium ICC168]